ncbi:hypothetical protein PsorP6_000887 [Peronosclerospora sorghi]|uniref:Uncharacterized protein n=1 Tax=Peronosclerospora sorghi TaxID=230839 RepID=A0ACC0WU61_9STRA|nr:hypothetical protein PsorP6_000887 [Peronosclerospora sorghi]
MLDVDDKGERGELRLEYLDSPMTGTSFSFRMDRLSCDLVDKSMEPVDCVFRVGGGPGARAAPLDERVAGKRAVWAPTLPDRYASSCNCFICLFVLCHQIKTPTHASTTKRLNMTTNIHHCQKKHPVPHGTYKLHELLVFNVLEKHEHQLSAFLDAYTFLLDFTLLGHLSATASPIFPSARSWYEYKPSIKTSPRTVDVPSEIPMARQGVEEFAPFISGRQ